MRLFRSMAQRPHVTPDSLLQFGRQFNLSAREQEVFALLVEGLQLKEVAARLHISSNTARNHNASLFRKCQVNSRQELMHRLTLSHPT
jgi:DNA-binding NarL/FixJ family response regulator